MSDYNWSEFTKRIPLNTTGQSIYDAWCTSGGLKSWFLRKAIFKSEYGTEKKDEEYISPGDNYEWLWHGWDDNTMETGAILAANGKNEFHFTFGKAGNVAVKIYAEGDCNICELIQSEIPTDENGKTYYHLGCSTGWVFYLANLKSILEGGIDLRNKDASLKNVVNS